MMWYEASCEKSVDQHAPGGYGCKHCKTISKKRANKQNKQIGKLDFSQVMWVKKPNCIAWPSNSNKIKINYSEILAWTALKFISITKLRAITLLFLTKANHSWIMSSCQCINLNQSVHVGRLFFSFFLATQRACLQANNFQTKNT